MLVLPGGEMSFAPNDPLTFARHHDPLVLALVCGVVALAWVTDAFLGHCEFDTCTVRVCDDVLFQHLTFERPEMA